MRKLVLLCAAVVVLLALSYALTGVTQVQPGERAVVRRLGRVLEEQPGPGLWFGLPWGIDVVRPRFESFRTMLRKLSTRNTTRPALR